MFPQKSQVTESLLLKYRIPVQHLDFSYVEKCDNAIELERILQILQSGEEGFYPELQAATEQRLAAIKPKSRFLRNVSPVMSANSLEKSERILLNNEINNWLNDIDEHDSKLKSCFKNETNLPEVRKIIELKEEETMNSKNNSVKRIASTDYQSWDKYDPETEILKMDLQDEKAKKKFKITPKLEYKNEKICEINNQIEADKISTVEREKGNEFFKSHDYKHALFHYNNSINIKPTVSNLNNRALVYIKLKKYDAALKDCEEVLKLNPFDKKALLRKAQTLEHLQRIGEAYRVTEKLINVDPNNSYIQELAEKFRNQCKISTKKPTRVTISDVQQEIIVPIPGFSKNDTGPHYVKCPQENLEKIETNIKNHLNSNIIRIVPLDDDDDCCVIHVKEKKDETMQSREEDRKENEIQEGGGDFIKNLEPEIEAVHSPYTFLKLWLSACSENNLQKCADILKKIEPKKIREVIGYQLDNEMLTNILQCLSDYFIGDEDTERIAQFIENIITVPRFDIISLLLSEQDRELINKIVQFLRTQNVHTSENVINKLLQ